MQYAVVVPIYRAPLDGDEHLSLRHLEHFLPEAKKIFAMPDTLDFRRAGYERTRFAATFFSGIAAYNRLMLSREFYARFEAYEFVLIYQLDALILSSDVERFLVPGLDYLGAPWIDYDPSGAPSLAGVGNGGFSLRRVSAFRQLLESRVRSTTPQEYFRRSYARAPGWRRVIGLCKAGLKGLGIGNSIHSAIKGFGGNEDGFIASEARRYSPQFTIGSTEKALQFAFEREPRFCYQAANGRMPLGAHAWGRYDRSFWVPYLLS
jgi:hypothetical protein